MPKLLLSGYCVVTKPSGVQLLQVFPYSTNQTQHYTESHLILISKTESNVYINQRDKQMLVNSLYFFVKWLYMFQEQHLISCTVHLVPACTNCTVQLIKCCSWRRTNDNPKHVEQFNEKIETIHNNLCISLVYIHIAMMHGTYNIKRKANVTRPI